MVEGNVRGGGQSEREAVESGGAEPTRVQSHSPCSSPDWQPAPRPGPGCRAGSCLLHQVHELRVPLRAWQYEGLLLASY